MRARGRLMQALASLCLSNSVTAGELSCDEAAHAIDRYSHQVKAIRHWVESNDIPRVCGQNPECRSWSLSALNAWERDQKAYVLAQRISIQTACRAEAVASGRYRAQLESLYIDLDKLLPGAMPVPSATFSIPPIPAGIHHTWKEAIPTPGPR